MEQANIPTQEGLNALYGAWNPMAYIQGQQNQDLASQFRQQAFDRNALDTRKVQQGYDQDAIMNPLRVDNQRNTNAGQLLTNNNLGFENITKGLEAERAKANQSNLLNADQRAAALKVSEDEMKKFEFHVGELMRSPHQAERDQGIKLQTYLAEFQKERRKHQDAMDVANVGANATIKGHQISAGSAERIAKMNIDAGRWTKTPKTASDVNSWNVKFSQSSPDKRLGPAYMAITTGLHPFSGEPLTDAQTKQFQALYDQDLATINAGNQSRASGAQGVAASADSKGGIKITDRPPANAAPGPKKPQISDQDLINQYLKK